MIKKIIFPLLLTISLSITACNTPSQNTTPNNNQPSDNVSNIEIKGIVNDPNDKPMSDVNITVKDNSNVLATTKSDSKGEFSVTVPKVFGDSYFIEAKKELSDGSLDQTLLISVGEKADFTGNNKLRKTLVAVKPLPIP